MILIVWARTRARSKAMAVMMENGEKEEHLMTPKFLAVVPGMTTEPSRSTGNVTEEAPLKQPS